MTAIPGSRADHGAATTAQGDRSGPDDSLAATAARVAAGLVAAIAVVAVAVRILAPGAARGWLHFPFTGVPATVGEASGIFANNARAMLGLFGLLLIAQLAARRADGPARTTRALQHAGETVLTGMLAANVAVVGAALGAYDIRMALALLPHGPVELAAFALAIALYLKGRRRPLPVPALVATAAASLDLLALAALLEALVVV